MHINPKYKIPLPTVKWLIVIFYGVGTLGFLFPETKDLFIAIIPFAILLNTSLLFLYHKTYSVKTVSVFLLVFLLGFFIEIIGVNTGLVFGNYQYGSGLGLKVFSTPLLIGVNWLFLTYASTSVVSSFRLNKILSVVFPPFLMLIYDLVLEQVAPIMDMWAWQNNSVPLQNYVAWYVIALAFVSLFKIFKIDTNNGISKMLLVCQFIFFVLLMLVFN